MPGARSRLLVKLAISTSTGVFREEQTSSVSQPSFSQGDSTKKVVKVTGAQVQSATAERGVEQHNIREQDRHTNPSEAEPMPEIEAIMPSSEFHDVIMDCTTQTHHLEIERHDEVTQNQSDTDFSSGSNELYAPPESEYYDTDDCVGSVVEISTQDVTTQQQPQSISDTDQNIPDQEQSKPRKRKGQVNKNEWKRLKNAKLRLEGKSYVGFEKQGSGKYKQTKLKEAKCLGPRCNGHPQPTTVKGGPRQDFKCDSISEDDRKSIHSYFWNLSSWEAKKVYVTGCVLQARPKYRRKTTDVSTSRKNTGFTFYFTLKENGDDVKKRVCRNMFINTLSIGEKTVRSWILSDQLSASQESEEHQTQTSQQRSSIVKNVEEFLNSLPKVESHYCRASSSKLYIEPLWSSLREIYRFYKVECQTQNKIASSWKTFYNTLKNMNLDLYVPKKDQCNTCTQYKTGTCDEETFRKHEQKKQSAREEKARDKEQSINCPNIETYAVDLQAVLLAPRLNASANYYKTKLKVHNETFFNLSTKDAVCYVWHEAVGGIESDVFASIYTHFIQKEIEKKNPEKITIWSDGCGYQNRNIKLSNALLELSIKTNITIEQKYLEVGHTFMEVDSIHSTIEKKLRNRKEVYTPADYIPIINSARQCPRPYETIYCSSDDFYAFEPVYYKSIRPGKKVGDPCVNDVVAFQYTPNGIIRYKLCFQDEWSELPVRPKRLESLPDHPKLYTGPIIPIEASKYTHLQELKELIPQDYRPFYETLLHK